MKNLKLFLIGLCLDESLHKQYMAFLLIAGFVLASLSSQAQELPCFLEGYTNKGTYNGHTYFLSNFTAYASDAGIAAAATGGHLATIADDGENNFVAAVAGGGWAWIGFNDTAVEGNFVWETGEPVTYVNWCDGEPNNYLGDEYLTMTNWCSLGRWNDLFDGVPLPLVVEFDDAETEICNNGIDDDCDGNIDYSEYWTVQNPETSPFISHAEMAHIGGDKVLIFGGYLDELVGSDESWVYDLSDDSWTEPNPTTKPMGRYGHALAYIGGDKVLLYGGVGTGTETWVYDLSDNTWTLKNPTSNPGNRELHAMATIGSDQVLLFGGWGSPETWVYDLSDDTWTLKSPSTSPPAQYGHAMASIGSDKVLLFYDNVTWVYDLSDDSWTLQNPGTVPPSRIYHQIVSLSGDKVLMYGGWEWNFFYFGNILGDTWVYDLSDNTWTLKTLPFMTPAPQAGHTMAFIGNGKAICLGGSVFFNTATWLYTASEDLCTQPTVSAGDDEHLYFGYGPGQCKTKTAVVTEGTAPYAYTWALNRDLLLNVINSSGDETMTGANTASVTVCLLDTAELCVTVTDANGNTATDCAMMFGEDVRCFSGNNQKVNVCHNGNTICIDENALDAHLAHGDYVGICTGNIANPNDVDHGGFVIKESLKPEFNLYPNPSNGDFTISMDFNDPNTDTGIIQILNLSGQVVKRINIKEQRRFNIDLEESGVYFIQLITNKQIITQKLSVLN